MKYHEPCPCCGGTQQYIAFNKDYAEKHHVRCICGLSAPWVGYKGDPWAEWDRLAYQVDLGRDIERSFQ